MRDVSGRLAAPRRRLWMNPPRRDKHDGALFGVVGAGRRASVAAPWRCRTRDEDWPVNTRRWRPDGRLIAAVAALFCVWAFVWEFNRAMEKAETGTYRLSVYNDTPEPIAVQRSDIDTGPRGVRLLQPGASFTAEANDRFRNSVAGGNALMYQAVTLTVSGPDALARGRVCIRTDRMFQLRGDRPPTPICASLATEPSVRAQPDLAAKPCSRRLAHD